MSTGRGTSGGPRARREARRPEFTTDGVQAREACTPRTGRYSSSATTVMLAEPSAPYATRTRHGWQHTWQSST